MATSEGLQPPATTAQSSRRNDTSSHSLSPQILALHRHLTNALLKPVCPDIQLRAFNRIYSLHRIFLVQSTFFNSLLDGDFKEAKDKKGVWKRKGQSSSPSSSSSSRGEMNVDVEEEENAVEIHFDDPNITRPAFEYCLATLYAAAPTLVLPSWSCPSPEFPLTSHFQLDSSGQSLKSPTFSSTSNTDRSEKAQHPATPRFLLSLIATATYLGIPSVCSQAVTLILCSITPYTVSQYLRFSLGLGILGASEAKDRHDGQHSHWDWELEGPAWGLEGLSKERKPNSQSYSSLLERTERVSLHDDGEEEDEEGKAGSDASNISTISIKGAKESSAESFLPSFLSERDNLLSHQGRFYYGAQSDKIGEACSCWLLRWGADVLLAEEQMQLDEDGQDAPLYLSNFTLPRNVLPVTQSLTPDDYPSDVATVLSAPHPTVWCHPKLGGIPANWARVIISSDSFWIRSEWDRYDVARRVVAMRRSHLDDFVEADENVSDNEEEEMLSRDTSRERGNESDETYSSLSFAIKGEKEMKTSRAASHAPTEEASMEGSDYDEDETEYDLLFAEGIYYTHMTFEELSAISNQVCSSTGSTYVPMTVLQSALWAQSELKGMILSKEKATKSEISKDAISSPDEEGEELNSSSKKQTGKNTHPERELGLVSGEVDFAVACQSLQKKSRSSRSNSSIVSSDSFGLATGGSSSSMTTTTSTILGGMRPLMLMGASSKARALENLLDKRFFAVPSDDTIRIGENLSSLINNNNIDSTTSNANRLDREAEERGGPSGIAAVIDSQTIHIAHDAKRATVGEYFGVQNAVKSGRTLGQEYSRTVSMPGGGGGGGNDGTTAHKDWTGYEPMRLGVEFFGVDRLKEKERMYSPSFFYAGSIWNLYLQIIKKPKGLQLGIYLHRQNCNDTLPNPSYPSDVMMAEDGMNGEGEPQTPRRRDAINHGSNLTGSIFYTSSSPSTSNQGMVGNDGNSTPVQSSRQAAAIAAQQQTAPASNTRIRSTLHPYSNNNNNNNNNNNTTTTNSISLTPSPTSNRIISNNQQTQYHDQRRILRAYFSVHCPSPLGTSLTKFSSRPDNFSLSQSWGWKSSSLLGAVHLSENKIGTAENQVSPIFRCIVTVGVV